MCFLEHMTTMAATVEDQMENFIYNEPKPEKVVYLTFDDGPSRIYIRIIRFIRRT